MTHEQPLGPADKLIRRLVYAQSMKVIGPVIRQWLKWKGIDIPPQTIRNAHGLQIPHGGQVTVHASSTIGPHVTLMQGATLGRGDIWRDEANPGGVHLEEGVIIGAGAAVLFTGSAPLCIGKHAIIGANAVIRADVPPGTVWAGNPARKVRDR